MVTTTQGASPDPGRRHATDAQIAELANAIALQADAIARGSHAPGRARRAACRLLAENALTLRAWTDGEAAR